MIKTWVQKIDWKSYFLGVAIGIIVILVIPTLFAKENPIEMFRGDFQEFRDRNMLKRGESNFPSADQTALPEDGESDDNDTPQKFESVQRTKPRIPKLPNTSQ